METKSLNKKTLLLLLLISIIPLVGAFVGLVLIILGSNQKQKQLIRIGIFGVITTILTYSIAIIIGQNIDSNASDSDVRLTKKVINQLILEIHEYKINYGNFPKDLETLSKSDEKILINDPILLFKKNHSIKTTFEYETDGKSFKLFSVGVDGKSNTKDDIYPKK
jgi:hypothetical protein